MMKKIIYSILTIVLCSLLFTGCGNASTQSVNGSSYSVTDSQGTQVQFSKKPQRIVTLSMSTDEIVLGLVKTDRLAAVSYLLDDPTCSNITALAQKIPTKIKNPSAEEIFAMNPDVVIVPNWNNIAIVDNLRDLGLKVVVVPGAENIVEVKQSIQLIANSIGEHDKGQQLIGLMDEKLADIKTKVDKIPSEKREKIVLISLMTTYGGIGCAFDDACKYAGVINGLDEIGLHNGQALTKEALVQSNPDILLMPVYNDHNTFDVDKFNRQYLDDPSLQTIDAIKNNKLVYPREGYIYNDSQDIVFSIQEIARCAYGNEFDFPDNMHLSVSGETNQ